MKENKTRDESQEGCNKAKGTKRIGMSEREMVVQEKDSQRGVENEKGHQNQKDYQNKKCDSESGVGARREQNKDMMEIEQTKDQEKEKGESLKVLDQNRVRTIRKKERE